MNDRLLRSILQLYALLAGSDGLLDSEKSRISSLLGNHLSGKSLAAHLARLDGWAAESVNHEGDFSWMEERIQVICQSVNKELLLTQKFYLYLELLELSGVDGVVSESEKRILQAIPRNLHLPPEEVITLEQYASGTVEADFHHPHMLRIHGGGLSGDVKAPQLLHKGFDGLVVVLKLPSIEDYFVRVLHQTETYLNGQLLQPGISRIWAPGTTLRQNLSEPLYFQFVQERLARPLEKPEIFFEARNISLRFRDGKIGLHKTSLAESGGRLVAIMGGSGCGKSTLFNVLNGNEKPNQGTVRINGIDIHRQGEQLEGVVGYVPQDDLLNERLSVFQNLAFAARFSFGDAPEQEIQELCQKTLHALGLLEVKDKEVGSPAKKTISGGQRKRLNIGMELIREPSVLFVDEPTSGLSSSDSLRTMELLKNLTLNGKLVFVIIHQPSAQIFRMFDRLLVLDQGGRSIYYGNPLEAVPYFRQEAGLPPVLHPDQAANAAEIFDIVESKLVSDLGLPSDERKFSPQDWFDRFQARTPETDSEPVKKELPHKSHPPGFFRQISLFFQRDLLSKLHDQQYLLINLLEAPLLALLLAIVVRYAPTEDFIDKPYLFSSNENIPAYFFMSVIVALFMGLSVSAEEIIRDRLLLKREKFLHLSRDGYLIAKILMLFGLSALHTLAFVAISDFVLEVNDIGWEFWAVLFSVSCCANMLGLVLSDTFKNAVVVYILIPLLLIPQLVLGGVVIRYDRLNPVFGEPGRVPLVGETMVSRWAYEALMVAQFKNNPFQQVLFEAEAKKESLDYKRSVYLPELERLLSEVREASLDATHPHRLHLPIKRHLLYGELCRESARFKEEFLIWTPLKGNGAFPESTYRSMQQKLKAYRHWYNKEFQKAQKDLDAIFRRYEDPKRRSNRLLELKPHAENEQVARILADDLGFQPKVEIARDGIFRKVKPVFHFPEPKGPLDFRTHFFAPVKFFAGRFFPTEYFNIGVIWLFTLLTLVVLKFRLLRRLFRFSV